MKNIDYIGLGYDIILGNPHNTLHDPGFQQKVMVLSYTMVGRICIIIFLKAFNFFTSIFILVLSPFKAATYFLGRGRGLRKI
jgi:hypothetical protein